MKKEDLILPYFAFKAELRRGVPPSTPEVDALHDAHRKLEHLVQSGPIEESWQLTREVLRRAPDDELREYAVALLELFVNWRREVAVPLIEREALADERFRWALGCIYLDSDLSQETIQRLRRASDNVISVPGRRER